VIPRIVLGSSSKNRPNRDGRLAVIPGATLPLEFHFDGDANKPLNLTPFTVKLVFWKNARIDVLSETATLFTTSSPYDIVCAVACEIADPYKGTAFALVNDVQTELIGNATQNSGVRWGVFLINPDNQVFPMIVSSSGAAFGEVITSPGDTPSVSIILGA